MAKIIAPNSSGLAGYFRRKKPKPEKPVKDGDQSVVTKDKSLKDHEGIIEQGYPKSHAYDGIVTK